MTALPADQQLLFTPMQLASVTGLGETTIRDCINARSKTYPPLRAKRIKPQESRGAGRLYITKAQVDAWLAAFPDA